jgi:hypothetical protein
MKNIITFIKESNRSNDPKAPADVQKYLGLKYADGSGGGDSEEKITFTGSTSAIYQERGKIEGQDKIFAVQGLYTKEITDDNATIWVCTSEKAMGKKLTIVAIYTTDKDEAKQELKEKGKSWKEKVEKIVLCKDTKDVVYNIRNDYGKVTSYRNAGHGEEKDGIIYSTALNK